MRHLEISRALSEASTDKEFEQVAAKYGLYLYRPVVFEVMSGQTNIGITAPTMTYDSFDQQYEFAATMTWNSYTAIQGDACYILCDVSVGGKDTIGLYFSNWSAAATAASYYTTFKDKKGVIKATATTVDQEGVTSGTSRLFSVSDQDHFYNDGSTGSVYDWWQVRTSVWVSNWSTSVHGRVNAFYGHTYNQTDITGVDFSAQIGSDAKLQSGVNIHFTNTSNRWAAQGADLGY